MTSGVSDHDGPILADLVDPQRPAPQGETCTECGAPLDHDAAFCSSCGHRHVVPVAVLERARQAVPTQVMPSARPVASLAARPQKHFQCQNCGSTVSTDPQQRSYVCAFCGSTYVVEYSMQDTGRHQPDFVIGFAITPEQAHEKFRQWIREKGLFTPRDLDQATLEHKLVGVYLPFWSFSMLAQSNWSAMIGEYWYRTETYVTRDSKGRTVTRTRTVQETEWWPLRGKHHAYYRGYLIPASKSLSSEEAEQIKPFQLPALTRYQPYFLAGWLCEEYSVAHDEALDVCRHIFLQEERQHVAAFMPGDTHRHLEVSTSLSHVNFDLCLLPVYIWSYRYRDRLYRFLVNGQTGRVAGSKPVSHQRIAVVVLLALLLLALIAVLAFALSA